MVTIFLLWTLVAGKAQDVDAFTSLDSCELSKAQAAGLLAQARPQHPELEKLEIVGCQPIKVAVPGSV
jgi:hypothetical protein